MISVLVWVVLAFLVVVSVIDLKVKRVPSILLDGFLFAIAFITISSQPQALSLGLLGFIASYLLYEANFFHGIADIKVFTMISFMLINSYHLLGFLVLVMFFGIIYKSVVKIRTKDNECAFLPVFLATYITMVMLGGVA